MEIDPAPAALVSPTLPMDDMETVPEEIPSVALNELLPVSVKVPVQLMVNPPPALLMLPLTLVLPEPANVTVLAVLLLNKSPERVRSPESEVMRVVVPVLVILPVQVLLTEMLRRVPVGEGPPLSNKALISVENPDTLYAPGWRA